MDNCRPSNVHEENKTFMPWPHDRALRISIQSYAVPLCTEKWPFSSVLAVQTVLQSGKHMVLCLGGATEFEKWIKYGSSPDEFELGNETAQSASAQKPSQGQSDRSSTVKMQSCAQQFPPAELDLGPQTAQSDSAQKPSQGQSDRFATVTCKHAMQRHVSASQKRCFTGVQ